ncbi:hypothetical protein [Cellulomonas sp. URHD0024]|uniref:hypothetical protein n=1 Tax=Cellulomonas sp. URHD0024 TaxID=1302620 RepID=UPI0003F6E954|nr:hypothetical protein [Cellulomonas sp. URHD0024]
MVTVSGRSERRRLLALLLFVVAPVCAEYLTAYDPEVTGQAAALVGGLVILGPLYGAPAILIRELAARTRMHWTGILALAGAFGVLQAGVVDQSLFATSYMSYDDWATGRALTLIPPLGVAGAFALNFLVGHVVWSIGAPIALVETFDRRPGPRQPWLGLSGTTALVVLWVLASVVVSQDIRDSGSDQASTGQLLGAVAVAALLVLVACTFGRRRLPTPLSRRVPVPARVFGLVLVAALGYQFIPGTWLGVGLGTAILVAGAVAVTRWSRSAGWGPRHAAAVAGAAVVARALGGFVTVATTDPRPPGGFAQNTVLLILSLTLAVAAVRPPRPAPVAPDPAVTTPR